jgi:hypothetical protein
MVELEDMSLACCLNGWNYASIHSKFLALAPFQKKLVLPYLIYLQKAAWAFNCVNSI